MTYGILCQKCAHCAVSVLRQTSFELSGVITTVFILGTLNLAIGFILAASAEGAATRLIGLLEARSESTLPVQPLPTDTAENAPSLPEACEPAAVAAPFTLDSLPESWRRALRENRVSPQSKLESLLWTLKLELAALSKHLVLLEHGLTTTVELEESDADPTTAVLRTWQTHHLQWVRRLDEFANELTAIEQEPRSVEIASALQDLLMDHQFGAHQTTTALTLTSLTNGEAQSVRASRTTNLRRQLSEQIEDFYSIRDRVDELLATLLRGNGRLTDIGVDLQIEGAAEIYNRIGLEVLLHQWRADNPHGEQPACCLMLDIDRFSQKTERFGNEIGDVIISAFGGLLKSLVRTERGFDRVARIRGSSYILFLGSTAINDATMVAERTRQCIEATSFKVGENSFDVTTSLGLVEFDPHTDVAEFYKLLHESVAAAKNAGRNRTCVRRGGQPEIADTMAIQVKGRVIEIAEQPT